MITRRALLRNATATSLLAGASGLPMPALATAKAAKIGYVSPQTGPLAAFAEADVFVLNGFAKAAKALGLDVKVVVKDSQSNPNRASEVAKQLIVEDEVSLMLVASTPETTNPVATTCEAEGVPCISTVAPWQPWFIGQQGNPRDPTAWKPFNYAYHFFWGLEDVIAVFTNMWAQIDTNKKVGGLFPNDGDGNAWGDPQVGFPPVLAKKGYTLTDLGRYQNLSDDFSAQISAFKSKGVEIITGVMIPRTSPPFGTRPSSKASPRRQLPSARRSSSRRRSLRSATGAPTCRPKSGGRRPIPSSRRSTASHRAIWRRTSPPSLSGRGPSRSDLPTRSSKSPRTFSSAPAIRRSPTPFATPSRPPSSTRSSDTSNGAARTCRHLPQRTSVRRRWSAVSGD
jgi:Periplasmic binding protein